MTDLAISEITRRNLFDELRLRKTSWAGRLDEDVFLARIFDLNALPSDDRRMANMAADIRMHRHNFIDWEDDWVFEDRRLNLMGCGDDAFLGFLSQMVHPIVRSDDREVAELVELVNRHLQADGYELAPHTNISGKPVYAARPRFLQAPQVAPARKVADELASDHIASLITRMEMATESDPALAIGSAKEFVEAICKGILAARQQPARGTETLPQLVKATREVLDLSVSAQTSDTLRQMLSGLASITQCVAELRGQLGSGHGRHPDATRPAPTVARLSVNTAIALGVFLYETHRDMPVGRAVDGRRPDT